MALSLRIFDEAKWIFPMDSAVDPSWRTPDAINKYQENFFRSSEPPEGMLRQEGDLPGIFRLKPLPAKIFDLAKKLGAGVEKEKLVCEYGLAGWENMFKGTSSGVQPMEFKTVSGELAKTKVSEECIDFLGFFDQLREGLARAIINLTASGE
jgi:hypothetical protein